jgi:hypothetical protein
MPDNFGNAGQQQQQQQQQQIVNVNVPGSGDPALEAHIFQKLYSAGRQIGQISEVLEVLLAGWNPALASPDANAAIEAFRAMQREIADAKRERARDPERFVQQLETLQHDDPVAYQRVVDRLRSWLSAAGPSQAANGSGNPQ